MEQSTLPSDAWQAERETKMRAGEGVGRRLQGQGNVLAGMLQQE
jgi:hypothetical protein